MADFESKEQLVFVSHKSADATLAKAIVKELKSEMDNTAFFLSEDIEKGDDWRTEIQDKLIKSNCFILCYTDTTYDWSWCLYETVLFDELVRRDDPEKRKLYCIHYPGTPPPDPLQKLQTIAANNEGIEGWLASLYQTTKQTEAFKSLEATAARLQSLLEKEQPKKFATNNLRPSIQIYPAWLSGRNPNWQDLATFPQSLPLEMSIVETDEISAAQLGFAFKPSKMNLVEFLKRLDTEPSEAERTWPERFLESLQSTLEGRMTDQNVVVFRSSMGGVLRPVIESIRRSNDGLECVCRVVFIDAFGAPPDVHPSRLQFLANGLRLAVRTRMEVLNRYRGKMAQEHRRLAKSLDPADELSKRHPLGGRVMEILRTIILEAEMQGTYVNSPPMLLFEGGEQKQYEDIREKFKGLYSDLATCTQKEDQQSDGTYVETEKHLDALLELNKDYVAIAAPRFLKILDT
jgi:hypothetical protein